MKLKLLFLLLISTICSSIYSQECDILGYTGGPAFGPYVVKLKFHADPLLNTEESINLAIVDLNTYFNPHNIFFCVFPDYYTEHIDNEPDFVNILLEEGNNDAYYNGEAGGLPSTYLWVEYQMGTTLAHEIGHCLGLFHTFEDGSNTAFCTTNMSGENCEDCVNDTDLAVQAQPIPSLPLFNFDLDECQYTAPALADLPESITKNIMNYTSSCRDHFSSGQGARMRKFLAYHPDLGPVVSGGTIIGLSFDDVITDISHPTKSSSCANGSIAIDPNTFGTLNYLWSNGSESSSIENLSPGTYCVTISDDCGGEIQNCFTLECQCFSDPIDINFSPPQNGTVDISINFGSTSQFPISVSLDPDGFGWPIISSEQIISLNNQPLGTEVCLFITDADGCSFSHCFIIEGESCEDMFVISVIEIQPDNECSDNPNGYINLDINAEMAGCNFSVEWNTSPITTGTIASNLTPGTYCATITGNQSSLCPNCITVECFDIASSSLDADPITVSSDLKFRCWTDKEGVTHEFFNLTLEITGGVQPLDLDQPYTVYDEKYIFKIEENDVVQNQYCVNITDDCDNNNDGIYDYQHCEPISWPEIDPRRDCLSHSGGARSNSSGESKNKKESKVINLIYPNPVLRGSSIQLSNLNLLDARNLEIFNMNGIVLLEINPDRSEITIPKEFNAGVYYLKVNTNNEPRIHRFLVQ